MLSKEISLLGIGELTPSPTWHMAPHQHPHHHELIVVLEGKMLLKADQGELTAKAGDLLFYRSKLIHEETSLPSDPVHTLYLSFRGKSKKLDLPLFLEDRNGRVRQMAMWIQRDLKDGRSVKNCTPLLHAILEELHALCSLPPDPWVQDLRHFMREHMTQELSLAQLAKQGGMSSFGFVRKYKKLSGETPMTDLRLLRLNAAQQMILSSNRPFKDIAAAVGLGDEYQLSKLFRRYFGLPPRDFRRRPR